MPRAGLTSLPYLTAPEHLGQGGRLHFDVVIPTIRSALPEFPGAMCTIRDSISLDTVLHVLDGKAGKSQTLNLAYDGILSASDRGIYITMDDDYLPPKGWQERLEAAFLVNPRWGALGLWFPEDWFDRILGDRCGEETELAGIRYRPVPHNIIGAMIAFRREVAAYIGKIPDTIEKYQMWEDGWRCARVSFLGYEMAYLIGDTPTMIWYSDPTEYHDMKRADLAHGRAVIETYMKQGLRKSLLQRIGLRLRRVGKPRT